MTGQPERLGLGSAILWIVTRDLEAFYIAASEWVPKPQCILDDEACGDFFDFRSGPAYYLAEYRRGTPKHLRPEGMSPEEEVAKAEKELLGRMDDGCLYASLHNKELREMQWAGSADGLAYESLFRRVLNGPVKMPELKWAENTVYLNYGPFARVVSEDPVVFFARNRVSFERADVERLWPAKKPGPKVGQASPKSEWCHKAEKILGAGQVSLEHGVMTEIANRIQADGYPHHAPRTIADAIGPTVRAWIKRQKSAA